MKSLFCLVALLSACSSAGEFEDFLTVASEIESHNAENQIPEISDPETCSVVFTPSGDLKDVTDLSAAIWSDASRCEIVTGENGIPVTVMDRVYLNDGRSAKARTEIEVTQDGSEKIKIEIRKDMLSKSEIILLTLMLHEFGHVLGVRGHLENGLMAEKPEPTETIDDIAKNIVMTFLGTNYN